MREKLAIANQLRISRRSFSNNPEYKKICSKCYHAYIIECIFKRKKDFKIKFGGKYIQKFPERMLDWYNYILDIIYRFFLINFTPNDDKTLRKYILIHFGVPKPVHIKIAETPNEDILEGFLTDNGFKVLDEHFYVESTVYEVTKI